VSLFVHCIWTHAYIASHEMVGTFQTAVSNTLALVKEQLDMIEKRNKGEDKAAYC
jgi:hypothetical protein